MNKIILCICFILIALATAASVCACDADDCTLTHLNEKNLDDIKLDENNNVQIIDDFNCDVEKNKTEDLTEDNNTYKNKTQPIGHDNISNSDFTNGVENISSVPQQNSSIKNESISSSHQIEKNIDGKKLVVKLPKRLDVTNAFEIENSIKESLNGIEELTLDFKDTVYISSAFLRSLMSLNKIMKEQGSMKLVHVSDKTMEVFLLTGFSEMFIIE